MSERWRSLLSQAFEDPHLVQSFSGVRTRFGRGPDVSPAHEVLASAYGLAYGRFVAKHCDRMRLLIGRDPRPTGPVLTLALARGFLAAGVEADREISIADLGIITTPLVEAAVRALNADGGVMITASHNPLTDNGWKFMTGQSLSMLPEAAPSGALLSAEHMDQVVKAAKRLADSDALSVALERVREEVIVAALDPARSQAARAQALSGYVDATEREWGMDKNWKAPGVLGPCLVDPNGGAACQIAAQVLARFGVGVIEEPSVLGWPLHSIDTDGIDPQTGEHVLLRVARSLKKRGARFGIAFDYDADRGNMVLPEDGEDAVIQPQIVAALNVGLTLARRVASGVAGERIAIVAHDSTSGRTDEVARLFGAKVVRVETGEINVVTRMRQLREEGYDVPIGVEGANGGTIFGHSTCRDGILTALSAALAEAQTDVVGEWMTRMGFEGEPGPDGRFDLRQIIACLPPFTTLSDKLTGKPLPHSWIKAKVESKFVKDIWPKLSQCFAQYRFVNYEGTRFGPERTGDETGGWVVELTRGDETAFIFLRGSRTEAGLWRLVADARDSKDAWELLAIGRELFASAQGN